MKNQFSIITDQAAIGINMIVATLAAFGIGYYFAAYYNPNPSFVRALKSFVVQILIIQFLSCLLLFVLKVYGCRDDSSNWNDDNGDDFIHCSCFKIGVKPIS